MSKLICSVFVLALLFAATAAKNSSPAPAVDCSSVILEMADCLSYVTADGTATRPEGNCCSGLKSVLKTNAECLCEAFRNSAQLGVTLNMTKAMALPSACHVAAPSVFNCGTMSNGGAPGQSPMLSPTSSVAGAPTAGISANDISPAPAPSVTGVGGASSSAVTIPVEFFGLATLAAVSLALF